MIIRLSALPTFSATQVTTTLHTKVNPSPSTDGYARKGNTEKQKTGCYEEEDMDAISIDEVAWLQDTESTST